MTDVGVMRWCSQVPKNVAQEVAFALSNQKPPNKLGDVARLISSHLTPAGIKRRLDPVSTPARNILDVLAIAQGPVPRDWLLTWLEEDLGSRIAAQFAYKEVTDTCLVLVQATYDDVRWASLVEPAAPLCGALLEQSARSAEVPLPVTAEGVGDFRAVSFREACILASLFQIQPRLNRDSSLHRVDLKKLHALFGDEESVETAIAMALELGVPSTESARWVPQAQPLRELCAASPRVVLAKRWYHLVIESSAQATLGFLLSRPGWHSEKTLERVLAIHDVDIQRPWQSTEWTRWRGIANRHLRQWHYAQMLVSAVHNGEIHYRLSDLARMFLSGGDAQPTPATPAGCHVQANFEIIVPPETASADVIALGEFADVVSVDQVARMAMSPESIARGTTAGLTADDILSTLQRLAKYALPDNVVHSVRDFAAHSQTVQALRGFVLQVAPQNIEKILSLAPEMRQLTGLPVLIGPASLENDVRRRLAARGFGWRDLSPTKPTQKRPGENRLWQDLEERLKPPTGVALHGVTLSPAAKEPTVSVPLTMEANSTMKHEDGKSIVRLAIEQGRNLFVQKGRKRIELTPHKIVHRGVVACLAGHEAGTYDGHIFELSQVALTLGPRTIEEDLDIADRGGALDLRPNDPCFCGSGKKYKKCCGSLAAEIQ